MKNTLPDGTQAAIEFLVRTAKAEGVLVTGFALIEDKERIAFMNFGTDSRYSSNPEFYKQACDLANKKIKEGRVVRHNMGEVV
jgi:hypothetical protein